MSLEDKLADIRAAGAKRIPEDKRAIMGAFTAIVVLQVVVGLVAGMFFALSTTIVGAVNVVGEGRFVLAMMSVGVGAFLLIDAMSEALDLAAHVHGADLGHLHAEVVLDRLPDLVLVGVRVDLEDELVVALAQIGEALGHEGAVVLGVVHRPGHGLVELEVVVRAGPLQGEEAVLADDEDEGAVDLDHLHGAVFEVSGLRHGNAADGA